ncbi:MAG: undecaprenyl/decaprenyl-phosphate alpha-N-acetylglucosaminyl 1-phosphate transferase, partial [Acidobacteria bacterium]|nr:undecaprenyl/decaprenyl-phosphate alpha-N-acetylglucosaminyl 1-phosphate transferase [Acidobacteriota bacterium]
MNEMLSNPIFIALTSFVLSLLLTFLVRRFARVKGFVAKPKADRWHKKPTALMGGVSVFLTTVIVYFLLVPKTSQSWIVLAGSSFLFVVGLVDDLLEIKPYQKLIGQIIGTAIVIGFGLVLPWTNSEIINIWLTVFWIIGITNAINLLDNMDGLAAGISAIAALTLAIVLGSSGQTQELLLVCAFFGAIVGFLAFNFNPASIFMGDSGSMFIGFFIASSVLLNDDFGGRSRGVLSVLAVPALILLVPIFDTTFVTVLRKLSGRKASQGGRDHTSHRLVALGLSERSAVLMLYALAILAGVVSFYVRELRATQSLALVAVVTILLAFIGVYLSKVKVYEDDGEDLALQNDAAFGFLINLSHKRRVFEVLLDALLITLAYYFAYVLLFGAFEQTRDWNLFIKTLPLLIVLKLGSFLIMGVY